MSGTHNWAVSLANMLSALESQAQSKPGTSWPTHHRRPHVCINPGFLAKKEEIMRAEARLNNLICWSGSYCFQLHQWKQTRPHWRVSRTCDALCGARNYLDEKMRPSMMSRHVEFCRMILELFHVESREARWAKRMRIRRYRNSTWDPQETLIIFVGIVDPGHSHS